MFGTTPSLVREPLTAAFRRRSIGGAAVYLLAICGLVLLSRLLAPPVLPYVAILVVGSALTSALLWREERLNGRTVMLVAALGHAIALFGYAAFEDDYYRFIWDGWRVLEIGTPYGVPPRDFFDDLDVPAAMQDVLSWINYPELPTIYGPTLQGLFALTAFFGGADALALRFAFAAAALLLTWLLLRRYPPGRVALFAWHPLVVAETTLHLHPDIVLSLFLFAALLAGRKHPWLAGVLLALSTGVKIVVLAAWPLLMRLRPAALVAAAITLVAIYGIFAVQGQGVGFDSTATFATAWYFNPFAFEALLLLLGPELGRLAALLVAGLLVLWLHASAGGMDRVPLAKIFGVILLFAPTVNAWYLLWLLPFALGQRETWPYVASAVLPLSYLTGINLEIHGLEDFEVHPAARIAQWVAIAGAILFDFRTLRKARRGTIAPLTPIARPCVSVIIPALNERGSVGPTVEGIRRAAPTGLIEIIVADNGSSDGTGAAAAAAGARVIVQPERGYGAACLAALERVDGRTNIVLFMDADLSDVPGEAESLIEPLMAGTADMVIGSRTLGQIEPGAMSVPQRFGNWLAPALMRMIWGERATDLGPFRAIRRDALDALRMEDRDFGWTIEMQVRAAKSGLRVVERPASYRKRVGVSKISGTMRGVVMAAWKILFVIAREALGDFDRGASGEQRRAGAFPGWRMRREA